MWQFTHKNVFFPKMRVCESKILVLNSDSKAQTYLVWCGYIRAFQKVYYVLYLDLYRGSYFKKTTFFLVFSLKYALFSVVHTSKSDSKAQTYLVRCGYIRALQKVYYVLYLDLTMQRKPRFSRLNPKIRTILSCSCIKSWFLSSHLSCLMRICKSFSVLAEHCDVSSNLSCPKSTLCAILWFL